MNKDWGPTHAILPTAGIFKEAKKNASGKEQNARSNEQAGKLRLAIETMGSEDARNTKLRKRISISNTFKYAFTPTRCVTLNEQILW